MSVDRPDFDRLSTLKRNGFASDRDASSSRDATRARPAPSSRCTSAFAMNSGGTIEDQIRQVDKVIKECDTSRKGLEQVSRRLDDLNDEVKRYRDFLGYEKARRDPALYKTNNAERLSVHNDSICGTLGSLTSQLSVEWGEKLRSIYASMGSPPPSTPGSRGSDRN
ncbi:unnamed protein product [Caenorhabditis auriculariae]|uniref:Uncharacterized protein n=1 Tax=Caenorhabditis auriculariae TaxID=2777116 RepID=A0A8S1HG98_9PELO|nr:unnamed protein product [Caenorhabditis auriculariae]